MARGGLFASAAAAAFGVLLLVGCTAHDAPASGHVPANDHRVTYDVAGSAQRASVTYETPTGSEQHDVKLPMTTTDGARGISLTVRDDNVFTATILAQNLGEVGSVACRITVDDVVVSSHSSSAAYGVVTCTAPVG